MSPDFHLDVRAGGTLTLEPGDGSDLTLTMENKPGEVVKVYMTARQRSLLVDTLGGPVQPAVFKENARFEDIRIGDRVRRTTHYGDGAITVEEDVVETIGGAYADGHHLTVARSIDEEESSITLTILERPKPEPEPEWNPGDLALDKEGDSWYFNGERWTCATAPYMLAMETEDLTRDYGPLRRAKVVEADQ